MKLSTPFILALLSTITQAIPLTSTPSTTPNQDTQIEKRVDFFRNVKGVSIYQNRGPRCQMRIFGVLQLPANIASAFANGGNDRILDTSRSVYSHMKQTLTPPGSKFAMIGDTAFWTSLFQGGVNGANAMGVSINADQGNMGTTFNEKVQYWDEFVAAVKAYWEGYGYDVTVERVTDASQVGNPTMQSGLYGPVFGPFRRDQVTDARLFAAQTCRKPQDLRKYFTNAVPPTPDSAGVC